MVIFVSICVCVCRCMRVRPGYFCVAKQHQEPMRSYGRACVCIATYLSSSEDRNKGNQKAKRHSGSDAYYIKRHFVVKILTLRYFDNTDPQTHYYA